MATTEKVVITVHSTFDLFLTSDNIVHEDSDIPWAKLSSGEPS